MRRLIFKALKVQSDHEGGGERKRARKRKKEKADTMGGEGYRFETNVVTCKLFSVY